jgi:hypothetical protein
MYTNGFVP